MAGIQGGNPYDCGTQQQGKRFNVACEQKDDLELSRISTHVFYDKSVNLSGLEGKALAQAILDAELACKATVIREASGTYDGGNDVTGKAGGRVSERITNTKHTVTGTDPYYVGNEKWWAATRSNQSSFNYLGVTSSRAWDAPYDLQIAGKGPITDDLTAIEGTFTVSWNKLAPYVSRPIDLDLLNQAPFLPFVGLTPNAPGNQATLTSSATLESIAVAVGDLLSYKATYTGATEYSIRPADGGKLPAGLAISDQLGNLTYTPAAGDVGEYLFYVRGESDCGVLGEIAARIIVTQ